MLVEVKSPVTSPITGPTKRGDSCIFFTPCYPFGVGVITLTLYNQSDRITYTVYKQGEICRKMPRQPDPELPPRILAAADQLWQQGGEDAVTIRGVAAAAGTTTPTVYSYYESREALLTALRAVAFARFTAYLAKSKSFEESCERHLEFGERYARDYELLYGRNWLERVTPERQTIEIGG